MSFTSSLNDFRTWILRSPYNPFGLINVYSNSTFYDTSSKGQKYDRSCFSLCSVSIVINITALPTEGVLTLITEGNRTLQCSINLGLPIVCPLFVSQWNTDGSWTLHSLFLANRSFNATYTESDFIALGININIFNVTSLIDYTPPQLYNLTLLTSSNELHIHRDTSRCRQYHF